MDNNLLKHNTALVQILLTDWPSEARNAIRDALTWDTNDISKLPVIMQSEDKRCVDIRRALKNASAPVPRSVFKSWKKLPSINAETVVYQDNNMWADDVIGLVRYVADAYSIEHTRPAKVLFVGIDSRLTTHSENLLSAWCWGAAVWKNHMHPLDGVFQHGEDPTNTCGGALLYFAIDSIVNVISSGDMRNLISAGRCLRAMWDEDLKYSDNMRSKIIQAIHNRFLHPDCNESEQALLTYLCEDLRIELDIMESEQLF